MVFNPEGRHYKALKKTLEDTYEDNYLDEDVVFMERNSRIFQERIHIINANAETICDFLYSRRRINAKSDHRVITQVFYPKYSSRANYDRYRLPTGGYGGLFSVTFVSQRASEVFYNKLRCHKGPSLGTTFTLACPYVILGHYGELDWAAGFGVEVGLVRLSVGCEDQGELLEMVKEALAAAEATFDGQS